VHKILEELEKLQDQLRRYESPRINRDRLEDYFLRVTGEIGRPFMQVAAQSSLGYERALLYCLLWLKLLPTQREAIGFYFGDRMTLDGIAIALGVPARMVRERIARGMRRFFRLRARLQRAGVVEIDP
jgi:DNA-directed RNA polymerase specialized sigma24 family protein